MKGVGFLCKYSELNKIQDSKHLRITIFLQFSPEVIRNIILVSLPATIPFLLYIHLFCEIDIHGINSLFLTFGLSI